jgi:hypothetical protein
MNTYTALVSAKVGTATKLVKTEIKATCASDAKWLLQAVYGFHSVASFPQERREVLTSEDLSKSPTPEQQRLNALKSSKNRANDALKAEKDRQKRQRALSDLKSLTFSST